MTILNWAIMIGIALTIIFIIMSVYFLSSFFARARKLSRFPKRPPKNKGKKKRWYLTRKRLLNQKKNALKGVLTFFLIALMTGGSTAYGSYFQSVHLSTDDSDLVVRSYYLRRDFQEQIELAANEGDDEEVLDRNIRYLATNLASYASVSANSANSIEGQQILNRYYAAIGELGMNASRQVNQFYGDNELLKTYENDLARIKTLEEQAFDYYRVDQEALTGDE